MKTMSYIDLVDRASRESIPLSAVLEITNGCNLNCVHCYQPSHKSLPDELTRDEWISVLESLVDCGCLFLTVTGGEPFTRSDALEICREARRRGFALRVFTNGVLVDESLACELSRLNPVAVEISIYGPDPESHEQVSRLPGSFACAVRAVGLLVRHGISVVVKSPVMPSNTDRLDDMNAMCSSLGAELRLDLDIVPCDDGSPRPLQHRLSNDQLAAVLSIDWMAERFPIAIAERPDDSSDICGAARRTCAISSTGNVYPCIQLPVSAGNVRQEPFEKIWMGSSVMLEYRAKRVRDLCETCRVCSRFTYCGRCGALALAEDGDYLGISSWACRVAQAKERAAAERSLRSRTLQDNE